MVSEKSSSDPSKPAWILFGASRSCKCLSMSQMNELKREIREAKKLHLSWRTRLLIFIVGAPTVFLFGIYGRLELAMPLIIIIGMHGLVIDFKWKLRRQAWFWTAMTVSTALHVPLILFVPWTSQWIPAPLLVPFMAADWCAIIVLISIVGQVVERSRAAEA